MESSKNYLQRKIFHKSFTNFVEVNDAKLHDVIRILLMQNLIVEKTNNIGNPEEKPNKSIFNDFSLKK